MNIAGRVLSGLEFSDPELEGSRIPEILNPQSAIRNQ
jgi:hypothetical protein